MKPWVKLYELQEQVRVVGKGQPYSEGPIWSKGTLVFLAYEADVAMREAVRNERAAWMRKYPAAIPPGEKERP